MYIIVYILDENCMLFEVSIAISNVWMHIIFHMTINITLFCLLALTSCRDVRFRR